MQTTSARHCALIAVFTSEDQATRAYAALVSKGIDTNHVAISIDLTRDGIAAEAPGQAYANQGDAQSLWQLFKGDPDEDAEEARTLTDVERGSVVVTVGPVPRSKRELIVCVLKEHRPIVIRGSSTA
jgi:hypothetical protein